MSALAGLFREALITPDGPEAVRAWARVLAAFAHAGRVYRFSRADAVALLRELRPEDTRSDNALGIEWTRQIRPRLLETGLVMPTRRHLDIRLDQCKQVLAGKPLLPESEPIAPEPGPAVGNLPARSIVLIGREAEQEQLSALLAAHPLVTLTGTGGVGKTTLALATAQAMLPPAGGIWFVDLSDARTADAVREATASVLGLPRPDVLVRALAGAGPLLLILDNLEQVVSEAGPLVGEWLVQVPELRVLATSRALLGVRGEVRLALDPLALPDPRNPGEPSAAVELFALRARQFVPDFAIRPAVAPAVIRICMAVGGLPLGIELAAARLRALGVDMLADRLEQGPGELASPRRDLPDQQRTLARTFDWSVDLLDPSVRQALLQLCSFHGSIPLDAAEEVIQLPGGLPVTDAIETLIGASLLRLDDESDTVRYAFAPALHGFGLERQAVELSAIARADLRSRHAAWFDRAAATAVAEGLDDDPVAYAAAMEMVAHDRANLLAAVAATLAAGNTAMAARLGIHLALLLREAGDPGPARPALTRLVPHAAGLDPMQQAQLDYVVASADLLANPVEPTIGEQLDRAIAGMSESPTDTPGRARWLAWMLLRRAAWILTVGGDRARADTDEAAALELADTAGLQAVRARVLYVRGYRERRDRSAAREWLTEAALLANATGRTRLRLVCDFRRARLSWLDGDVATAETLLQAQRPTLDRAFDPVHESLWLEGRLELAVHAGDPRQAPALADRLAMMAARADFQLLRQSAEWLRAQAHWLLGETAQAETALDAVTRTTADLPGMAEAMAPQIATMRGVVALSAGRAAEARELLEPAVPQVIEAHWPELAVLGHAAMARLTALADPMAAGDWRDRAEALVAEGRVTRHQRPVAVALEWLAAVSG